MQPQWAAYVAQTCQGDPPLAGMAQLYVEVAPANSVFALVDVATKHADVRSALQVVERQFGTIELHAPDPASVETAGSATNDDHNKKKAKADEADATQQPPVASN